MTKNIVVQLNVDCRMCDLCDSLDPPLEEKHLGPNSPRLATGSCIKTVSLSNQWRLTTSSSMVLFRWEYSAIHGEVCNIGASIDFITQMLFGTKCN